MIPTTKNIKVISEIPRLHIDDILGRNIHDGLFRAFYGTDASLFYFGRGALWHAVKSMHLSASDNVLVPSYHCGVEIEAVLMAGVQLRYYDIILDLTIDMSDLKNKIDGSTRAVFLIHYFGFPQPVEAIRSICTMRNVLLVEDCSQALFSSYKEKPLGTFGDIAIYSQRKTLPLPDGGALLVNNSKLSPEPPGKRPSEYIAIKKTLGMLFRSAFNIDPYKTLPYPFQQMATFINSLIARNTGVRYSTGLEVDMDRCTLAMTNISRQIMDRTPIEHIIQRRRDNYTCLLRYLTETPCIKIVRGQLPEGVCPLFFPVMIENVSRRDIQDRLMNSGIGTFVFGEELHPSLPKDQFRNAKILSRGILCLPVQQELNHWNMEYIAEILLQTVRELENAAPH